MQMIKKNEDSGQKESSNNKKVFFVSPNLEQLHSLHHSVQSGVVTVLIFTK